MDDPESNVDHQTIEEVLKDFEGRRMGILTALMLEFDKFHQQCDPEKGSLCLYGFPDKTWKVCLPANEVPSEIPDPAVGINLSRDQMPKRQWLFYVATNCDGWLLNIAFRSAAMKGFGKLDRELLFKKINDLRTVTEMVSHFSPEPIAVAEDAMQQGNLAAAEDAMQQGNLAAAEDAMQQGNLAAAEDAMQQGNLAAAEDAMQQDINEQVDNTHCGACGVRYIKNEQMWIGCDTCNAWYRGTCVGVTSEQALAIDQYACPTCVADGI